MHLSPSDCGLLSQFNPIELGVESSVDRSAPIRDAKKLRSKVGTFNSGMYVV